MSFIDLFAKGQNSSVHGQLSRWVLGGNTQRLSCLSANIIANIIWWTPTVWTHVYQEEKFKFKSSAAGSNLYTF